MSRKSDILKATIEIIREGVDLTLNGAPEMAVLKRLTGLRDLTIADRAEAMESLEDKDVGEVQAEMVEEKKAADAAVPDPTDEITDAQHKENTVQVCMRRLLRGSRLGPDGKPDAIRLGFDSGLKRPLTIGERDSALKEASNRLGI